MRNLNPVILEDCQNICDSVAIPWEKLQKRTILVTGATGLIGRGLLLALAYANIERKLQMTILGLVRDVSKARKRFEECLQYDFFHLIQGAVEELPQIGQKIDYIVHGASPTASSFFVKNPVETIQTAVLGTNNLLKLAKEKEIFGFVYLSSMETYGVITERRKLSEEQSGAFSSMNVRNSYPLSKLMCENLCHSYAEEYGMPICSLRLCQTFGPGVELTDNRVFAQFARSALSKENIILKTEGKTERAYLYTADAISAILVVLLRGEPGQIYNAANEKTYISIFDMARMVAEIGGIEVEMIPESNEVTGYMPTTYVDLDTALIRELGWLPAVDLKTMYMRMMKVM